MHSKNILARHLHKKNQTCKRQDFKLGGAHLKKLRRAEGGAKIFGVFRVKNHDFTPKNNIFSIAEGGAKIVEVFRLYCSLFIK
jgi:hypothetical protein